MSLRQRWKFLVTLHQISPSKRKIKPVFLREVLGRTLRTFSRLWRTLLFVHNHCAAPPIRTLRELQNYFA